MWQILHASFWKFTKLSNKGISLNWFITEEVTTCNTALNFWPTLYYVKQNETELFYFCNTFIKPFFILTIFSINIL